MATANQVLLILHFIGLAMGFSVPFSNMAMGAVMAKAAPGEQPVLARFMPSISRFGKVGLALLWLTGLALTFTKWGGFAGLPWQFHAKLTAVVLLTVVVIYITWLEGQIARGNREAMVRIQAAGKVSFSMAILAVIFAVLTFD